MKNRLITAVFCVYMAIMSVSASAMQMSQSGEKTVVLTGNIGEGNKQIALDVYKYGITSEDIEEIRNDEGNFLDVWITNQQTVSDSDGNYGFEFDVLLNSGKYTAYIYAEGIESEPYTFVFVSDEEYREIAKTIKKKTVGEIADILGDSKCYILGITEEAVESTDADVLAQIIYNVIGETEFDENNRDELWALIDKAYFVNTLNDKKEENIFNKDIKITNFDDSGIKDYYKKDFVTEAIEKNITRRLSGQGFKSYSEYKDELVQAFVLAVVEDAESVLYIEEIMEAFESETGINIGKNIPESVWNKLSGKTFNDFDELSEAFNKYVDVGNDISSSGSVSTGSSKKTKPIVSESVLPTQNINIQEAVLSTEIFDDISDVQWAKEAIIALAEKKIINGVGNNKFNPNANVTREQCVKIIVNTFIPSAQKVSIGFKDVLSDAWYYEYIQKAYGATIVSGYSNEIFGVGQAVTRQDMCVMIYNALASEDTSFEGTIQKFADDAEISDYAKTAVYALKECGAVSGMGENQFNPRGYATRAEMAKIIFSLIK